MSGFCIKIRNICGVYSSLYRAKGVIARHFSSSETLVPVKLSYATYENSISTNSDQAVPLVVLHGLFGSKSNWNTLCKLYQQKSKPQRKIIAVDVRNHGESAHDDNHTYAHLAADIKALLEQLNLSKVVLLGHSMGGRAVMLFALKYPELVERLIVADISPVRTSPSLDSTPAIFRALETVNLPTNVAMSQARVEVDNQLAKSIPQKSLRAFLLTNLIQRDDGSYNWRLNIPILLKNFNHLARFPLINELQYNGSVLFVGGAESDYIHYRWRFNVKALLNNFGHITLFPNVDNLKYFGPVLFVGASLSDYLPKTDHPGILKMFPNAEMQFIEGAGHWLHADKPQEFFNITLDFLNKKFN